MDSCRTTFQVSWRTCWTSFQFHWMDSWFGVMFGFGMPGARVLSIPLNGFEQDRRHRAGEGSSNFQFHWMDSFAYSHEFEMVYDMPFNSIEWILNLWGWIGPWGFYTGPFNSIEWIPISLPSLRSDYTVSLSIPLNGFLTLQWSYLSTTMLYFQFHWMDSRFCKHVKALINKALAFNSIEWIPSSPAWECSARSPFNSIEWIRATLCQARSSNTLM